MSTPNVERILVAESYGYRVKKVVDLPEKKTLNEADHISGSFADQHMRGNKVIHCVADPAIDGNESYK